MFATDTTQRSLCEVLTYDFVPADFNGQNDLIIYNATAPALQIIDASIIISTAEGAPDTCALFTAANGGGNRRSGDISVNAVGKNRQAASTPTFTNRCLGAGGSLYLHGSGPVANAIGTLVILARRNAV